MGGSAQLEIGELDADIAFLLAARPERGGLDARCCDHLIAGLQERREALLAQLEDETMSERAKENGLYRERLLAKIAAGREDELPPSIKKRSRQNTGQESGRGSARESGRDERSAARRQRDR